MRALIAAAWAGGALAAAGHGWTLSPPASGPAVDAPALASGDDWVYKDTTERGTNWAEKTMQLDLERVNPDSLLVSTRESGSTLPPKESLSGRDWSRFRSVNGVETVVNRPLEFPLTPGKHWDVDYTELNPNAGHKSEHFHTDYLVTGWEDVDTPAGRFRALKIEGDGRWSAILAPGAVAGALARVGGGGATTLTQSQAITARPISGRTYKLIYYAPQVKRWVKAVEEYYDVNGVRSERYTDTLQSYKVAG
ncbi:MAG: hypothetical protein ACR2F8_07080 [Caulobacteraceae bacterium]